MREEPWVAHEAPDRPFDAWMWLDDCQACAQALAREASDRPRLVLCLKTSADRIHVTAEYLHEILSSGQSLDSLCYVADDWVREVFVVNGSLPPEIQWRSLTLQEELETSPSNADASPLGDVETSQRVGVMVQMTSSEFNRDKKAAERMPVFITDRGRPAQRVAHLGCLRAALGAVCSGPLGRARRN